MKQRYEIKLNKKTKLFIVNDNQSPIKVICEDGSIKMGTFLASFYTQKEAEKFVDRLSLRNAWGV